MRNISFNLILQILIPFFGTTLGAFAVIFMKNRKKQTCANGGTLKDDNFSASLIADDGFNPKVKDAMEGFAAGVMTAASVWSLLIPAMDYSAEHSSLGKFLFLPATLGLFAGVLFLIFADRIILKGCVKRGLEREEVSKFKKNLMLVLAVTVHNFPEGMAVGVVLSGFLSGDTSITYASCLALTLGIAIQNVPEGAIISMPLKAQGCKKSKALIYGILSGVVEPVGAVLVMLLASFISGTLPYMLGFAAGAMLYVVAKELLPEMNSDDKTGTLFFIFGFALMMILDVALG